MKFDARQPVVGMPDRLAPQAVISGVRDALGIGDVDMPVTSQKFLIVYTLTG